MNTTITSPDQAIEDLKRDWDQLCDLDRARALAAIKKSGLSNRKIASMLPCSESSIRRLLRILLAPAADLAVTRNQHLSTNEILRRAKAEVTRKSARREKDLQREREEQVLKGTKLICDWLKQTNLARPSCEQIVAEARRMMIDALFDGSLPHVDPPDHPVSPALIIERCKPKEPLSDDIHPSGFYSKWLLRWIVFVFPDPDVREEALELALERQWKR